MSPGKRDGGSSARRNHQDYSQEGKSAGLTSIRSACSDQSRIARSSQNSCLANRAASFSSSASIDGTLTCLTDLSLVADDLLQKADDIVGYEILAM